MLRLHDTATGTVSELALREPGKVSLYVCGPTVYDDPHIGHGRHALVYDVLRRYLEWTGLEVRHVSNITDIDDKIIQRAQRDDRPFTEVTEVYEQAWWDALEQLNVLRPHVAPKATAFVKRMIELIGELESKGFAYPTSDGVYFATGSLDDYGLLARQPLDTLRSGERVEALDELRSPRDFALWKLAKDGEPWWPSPWGDGRPGWHTECVVMSLDLLDEGFDLHTGGLDLMFPHHENERAQAVALGHAFARHWMHHAHVVDATGEKMSKSLDNYTSLTDLLSRTEGRAYRLAVLQAHYRAPLSVTPEILAAAEKSVAGFDALARRMPEASGAAVDESAVAAFRAAMDDDLRTQAAMALVFDLVRKANAAADDNDAETAHTAAATVFALLDAVGIEVRVADTVVPDDVAELVRRRDEARAARDWASSDALRDELTALGWVVEDTPAGTSVRR